MADKNNQIRARLVRACRVLFGFIAAYSVAIIASDAWNLIPPEVVFQRWVLAVVMLASTGAVWYLARQSARSVRYDALLVSFLVLVYTGVAAFSVYTSRGMASRSVMLFVIPVLLAGILASRVAVFAAAIMSTAAYVLAVTAYFYANPGEGYKAELYTEAVFYIALLFVLAALVFSLQAKRT
jgi:K+-sensing histidine kinase KdpD